MPTLLQIKMRDIGILIKHEQANQIIELAVILPILLVITVGIFDFGQAFTLKQQLNNIAREAARLGSTQPTADLSQLPVPDSVKAIRDLIDSDLVAHGNDCGLGNTQSNGVINSSGQFTWLATGTCTTGTITVIIDRFQPVQTSLGFSVISTHINIQYPFQWHFTKVIQLIAPGAAGPSNPISGDAVMANLD